MKNNIYKEQICNNYRGLLEIIGIISKGHILQKQLIEYILLLDIASSEYKARKIIQELEYAELIKKIKFEDTNNKIIILRKFAIRFLQGKKGSQSVGAIPTCTTNKRYYKSIFINHYILGMLNTSKIFLDNSKEYGVISTLNLFNFNFILDNVELYKNLSKQGADITTINAHVEKIITDKLLKKQTLYNAKKGIKNTKENTKMRLTETEKRNKLIQTATLETLKRKDCYIRIKNTSIYVYYFDYCNTQNRVKIMENISIVMHIANQLFKEYKIQFFNYMYDDITVNNMMKKFNNDYVTDGLKLYGINISNVELLRILTIQFKNVDMYKNYLRNVKKLNV